ncbi:nicotinate-nucleotide--dimethylbenzimidazole phosphoribosyltransferase [Clostridium sp. MD294]|uniref:nicotinate-nucleotide--dimethylbenzimidazole phosphoribosyltransferase n=1 Tax=Clostridium sp. MD294 TaxID=97138 RepID=UPI0002CC50E2|nr:nicotinate-nucleotide--dimethylbenzimidazole phosphoribosyltransferase [Clostridium sp. MD294]NDO45807.1 nicotinate-nucleotide--dimethylbenzimidazole phosphoribosyltransferase [Clostridium sp. MD294]USF30538.1 Nicotinate-nucleotide--dimethylbenzimidazole phosphoribosyltransferase [Clostridium sp. MD294]
MKEIKQVINNIQPLFEKAMKEAKQYQDNLIKPIGSLGRIEELAITISGITGNIQNKLDKKAIIVMCADNGVYKEGVSTAPQEVTAVQTYNMLEGMTGISILSRQLNIDLKIVDIGINGNITHPQLIYKKINYGTKNSAEQEAMTKQEMEKAIYTGFELVKQLKQQGYKILGTGEMGISNTTTATSVIIALTGCNVEEATGKGAGLTEELFQKKKEVLKRILQLHHNMDRKNAFEVVQKVGGFDIAGLMGCFLGAAYYRIPIIVDGVISISAALAACVCQPLVKQYLLASHQSAEPAYHIAAEKIGLHAYFDLEMRLGEGTGCPFTMYLADAATKIMAEMATFEQGNVDKSNYIDIREDKTI